MHACTQQAVRPAFACAATVAFVGRDWPASFYLGWGLGSPGRIHWLAWPGS